MPTVIRHENWIIEGGSISLSEAIDQAKIDVEAYQSSDSVNYHAIDIYNLPDRNVWRIFSESAAISLNVNQVINPIASPVTYTLQTATATANGNNYCSVQMMLRYGVSELSQRSVNANDVMVEPDVLELLIRDGISPADLEENTRAWQQLGVINAAIEEASREIDSYLSALTATPLSMIPAQISAVCTRIARYRLARYEEGTEAESRVYRDYKLDLEYLQKLVDGKLILRELPPIVVTTTQTSGAYAVRAPAGIYQ